MPPETTRPLTIGLCQFSPIKGDTAANLARIGELCAQAALLDVRPEIIQFPEASLSGYFVEGGVRELAYPAGVLANDLDDSYRRACAVIEADTVPVDVVVGFYERFEDTLYNSVAYITIGLDDGPPVIRHVHRKTFLPTYGLFDEERFVERGAGVRAFETPWGRCALLICEDAWHSLSGTIAALDGAQFVLVSTGVPARGISASNSSTSSSASSQPESADRWERLIRSIAEEHGIYVSLANLTGTEGGKRFFGHSMLAGPNGDVRARAALWQEEMLVITVDLDDIVRARSDAPLLSDLRVALPHLLENLAQISSGRSAPLRYDGPDPAVFDLPNAPDINTAATVRGRHEPIAVRQLALTEHGGPPSLEIDATLTEEWLVGFLREEFARRNFTRAILGLSGGVDSAVSAALAARAFGPENVIALRLPYRTSSKSSLDHAQLMADQLGITCRTVDISAPVDGYLAGEPDADNLRRGNVMARMRMIALFDLSALYHALPLGTGNKTERLLGYFTWHADDTPPVNPIGDLYKTQVWQLAQHLGVPDEIVFKPATADLVAGQTDETDLGVSYAHADQILNGYLHGFGDGFLQARGFDSNELAIVRRRLSGTHWKRRLPSVALVSQTGIGESYLRPVDY